MQKSWIVLGATALGLILALIAANYQATHSGPFIHFRLKYPNFPATKLAEQGIHEINKFFASEPPKKSAVELLAKPKMNCRSITTGDLEFESEGLANVTIVEGFRCSREYGLMSGIRAWTLS